MPKKRPKIDIKNRFLKNVYKKPKTDFINRKQNSKIDSDIRYQKQRLQ
jgi:hypothetical protein